MGEAGVGNGGQVVRCQDMAEAAAEAVTWLKGNLPSFDAIQEVTLFGEPGGVDGLDAGVASLGANLSLQTRATYTWASSVPKDIWQDYVLPYALVNEPRTNWRPLLAATLGPLVERYGAASIDDVASIVNGYTNASDSLWTVFTPGKIVFKSSQTPLIFDPLSVIAFGYASCTGVSALFAAALRSLGVPARVAGTPAWNGNVDNGNHNWVEIWRGQDKGWSFIEAMPAGGGETLDNPCDKWFCSAAKLGPDSGTQVFAARFEQDASDGTVYPLAWDPENDQVPGVNRTMFYTAACGGC